MSLTITKDNFETEVLQSPATVLLDFWAEWCGPCRMIAPLLEAIEAEHSDLRLGKVNVDEQPELAAAFRVQSIPMMVVIKDGKVTGRTVGYQPKERIEALL